MAVKFLALFTFGFLTVQCGKSITNAKTKPTEPALESLYLGRILPIGNSVRFATDFLLSDGNWHWNGNPAFSPDGTEMYFSKYFVATSFYFGSRQFQLPSISC